MKKDESMPNPPLAPFEHSTVATVEDPTRTDHLHMPEEHMDKLYRSHNPLVRFIHCGRLNAIADVVPEGKALKILDAGCGEGHLLERLSKRRGDYDYYGTDITEVALEEAKTRCPYAHFKLANLFQTGFENEFFDAITCTEVLEHIYGYERVLAEFRRILKPQGTLILTFPNEVLWTVGRFLLGRRPVKVPDHVNSFNPGMMKKAVGLRLIKQISLPFRLPFALSLGSLMVFQKSQADIPSTSGISRNAELPTTQIP